eukprot:TRINITY_DN1164_c0_g1_i1.p1 TRINITY_DN1164_c0_g1~~TRINITY_DN1164_c0_g1_i1.p1  ORF type:complete len:96 (-),score=8.74 TRINITY_DN1164_c0_g1_i1:290-577(-)
MGVEWDVEKGVKKREFDQHCDDFIVSPEEESVIILRDRQLHYLHLGTGSVHGKVKDEELLESVDATGVEWLHGQSGFFTLWSKAGHIRVFHVETG